MDTPDPVGMKPIHYMVARLRRMDTQLPIEFPWPVVWRIYAKRAAFLLLLWLTLLPLCLLLPLAALLPNAPATELPLVIAFLAAGLILASLGSYLLWRTWQWNVHLTHPR